MKAIFKSYFAPIINHPRKTIGILVILFPSLGGYLAYSDKPSVEIPVAAKEKAVELQIKVIKDIVAPPKVMTETVTVTYEPHTHKALETRLKGLEDHHP